MSISRGPRDDEDASQGEQWWKQWRAKVLAVVRMRMPEADAEECVSAAFERMLIKAEGGLVIANVPAYWATAAINAARDDARQTRRCVKVEALELEALPCAGIQAWEVVEHQATVATVRAALSTLKAADLTVLIEHHYKHRSVGDIAREHGVSSQAISMRLRRAVRRLSSALHHT